MIPGLLCEGNGVISRAVMMRMRPWFQITAVLLLVLSGCATRQGGYKIGDDTIAFIQPGITSRAEVVENLGPPLLDLPDIRVSAYSWGKLRVTGGQPEPRQPGLSDRQSSYAGTPAPPVEERGLVEGRRWVCCIAWDGEDRVQRLERIEVQAASSLEQAVRRWAGAPR